MKKLEELLKGCGKEFKFFIGDTRGRANTILTCGQDINGSGYYCDACSRQIKTHDTEESYIDYVRKISRVLTKYPIVITGANKELQKELLLVFREEEYKLTFQENDKLESKTIIEADSILIGKLINEPEIPDSGIVYTFGMKNIARKIYETYIEENKNE